MAGKSKIVKGALGQLIDAAEIFKAKAEAQNKQKIFVNEVPKFMKQIKGRELKKFMGLSDEYIDAEEKGGIRFFEKPTYFEDIDASISSSQLNDLQEVLGRKLNTYNINDILADPKQPLSDLMHQNLKDEDQIKGSSFIVWDPDKEARYLANTSGANSYIRMWTGIDYK